MGTTSEKLTYLNTTKSELKQAINNLGGNIDSETTFREYVDELQDVYDNYPKTSYQEGTSITLENCNKGKLDFDNGIVGIGQSSQDSTQGYNILENKAQPVVTNNGITYTKRDDGGVLINGTASANSFCVLSNNSNNINAYGTELFTMQNDYYVKSTNDASVTYGYRNTSGTYKSSYNIGGETIGLVYINVANGAVINNLVIYPMIVNGSSEAKDFEPYTNGASPNPDYPQNINVVTGTQDVVVRGINIIGLDTNQYKVDIKAGEKITFKNEGTQGLTLNLYTNYGDTTRNDFWSIGENSTRTITVAYDTKAIAWGGAPDGLAWGNYGDTLSPYEPYITPTSYQLSLGDIELCGIGNYKDELIYDVDEDKVYKREVIKKYKLIGSIYDSLYNRAYTNLARATGDSLVLPSGDAETPPIMSETFKAYSKNDFLGSTTLNGMTLTTTGTFSIRNTSLSTQSAYDTWISTNDVYVFYVVRGTSIQNIEITDTTLKAQVKALYSAQSIKGTTVIESNGDLPIIIKVRALKGE